MGGRLNEFGLWPPQISLYVCCCHSFGIVWLNWYKVEQSRTETQVSDMCHLANKLIVLD